MRYFISLTEYKTQLGYSLAPSAERLTKVHLKKKWVLGQRDKKEEQSYYWTKEEVKGRMLLKSCFIIHFYDVFKNDRNTLFMMFKMLFNVPSFEPPMRLIS